MSSTRPVALVAGATRRPDCRGYIAAYGWGHEDGRGIDEVR